MCGEAESRPIQRKQDGLSHDRPLRFQRACMGRGTSNGWSEWLKSTNSPSLESKKHHLQASSDGLF